MSESAQPPAKLTLIMGSAGVRIWAADESLRHKYPDDVVHEYVLCGIAPAFWSDMHAVPADSAWQP